MNLLLTHQETERLHFRIVEKSDFEPWMAMFDGPNVAEFFGLNPAMSNKELCTEFFDRVFYRYNNDLGGMNALIDKSSGKLIGQCGLLIQTMEEKKYLEIGYGILPEYWGMGYATEAAKKCRDFGFENEIDDQIISIINIDNYGSMAVAQKNGMEIKRYIPDYKGSKINLWQIDRERWKSIYEKPNCEKCGKELTPEIRVYHCSYNCTYCSSCSSEMHLVCHNCKGRLKFRKSI